MKSGTTWTPLISGKYSLCITQLMAGQYHVYSSEDSTFLILQRRT